MIKAWFLNLPYSQKQILILIAASLIPMVLVSIMSVNAAKNDAKAKAFGQLEAVRDIKASAIARYFEQVESQITIKAQTPSIISAMAAFSGAFQTLPDEGALTDADIGAMRENVRAYYSDEYGAKYQAENSGQTVDVATLLDPLDREAVAAQFAYIANNTHPLGEKHLLDRAEGEIGYHRFHEQYHHGVRSFLEEFGYYDIFLVDIETGDIVYSVFKELDYGTSLWDGPYAETNFAESFRQATELNLGEVALVDYKPYTPSYEAPASFMATPIFKEGRRIGVLIFQMPLEPINEIMTQRAGMGETGETYLVGSDLLMRSDSYLDPDNHSVSASFKNPALGKVDTHAAKAALKGENDHTIIIDYNGNPVLSSYKLIDLGAFQWAILAEIDEAEAFRSVSNMVSNTLVQAILILAVAIMFSLYVSRLISKPILNLAEAILSVEKSGSFVTRVSNRNLDEVGQTSRAFNQLMENLNSVVNSTNHVLTALGNGNYESKITQNYSGQLGELTAGVNAAVEQVSDATIKVKEQANAAQQQSKEAEAAATIAKNKARETLIVKQALDVSATSVMITDDAFAVMYQNKACERMMSDNEKALQRSLPKFKANKVLGSPFSIFDTEQQALQAKLETGCHTKILFSGLTFEFSATPILDEAGAYLGAVVEWINRTEEVERLVEERRMAEENLRIRQALDNSSTSTLIADAEHNIIYCNRAMSLLVDQCEHDLKQRFPALNMQGLAGSNMSMFESEAALSLAHLQKIDKTDHAQFKVASSSFATASTPIMDQQGQRIGTVIEWRDRSAEVRVEMEIDDVIEHAARGNFNSRLETENKTGFFRVIGEGLNNLMATTDVAIADVKRLFSALSMGDLSQTIEKNYEGEFAQLKNDANNTVIKLRDVIGEISAVSSNIAHSSREINSDVRSLGERTEQQASSLEQTATSMDEMISTVEQSEANARKANDLSHKSVEIARLGNQSVEQTAVAMSDISEASNKIFNIISVIDEIAFQTNLLALNAAVEAARAGDQGRGFAVVAAEVRNLAQRSASSAKEIKDLIGNSVNKVEGGTRLVASSGETLRGIVNEIESVSEEMEGILLSAQKQSAEISQVSQAISYMESVTQENSVMVKHSVSASENMADQANKLDQLVSFFRS